MQNGKITHRLYVRIADDNDADKDAIMAITNKVLNYIYSIIPAIKQFNISIKVEKICSDHLKNQKVLDALKSRGITKFPALVSAKSVYLGADSIIKLYNDNIKIFKAQAANMRAASDDPLEAFYRKEMTEEKRKQDEEAPEGIDQSGDMMKKFNSSFAKRSKTWKDVSIKPEPQQNTSRDDDPVMPRTSAENQFDDDADGEKDDIMMKMRMEDDGFNDSDY